MRSQLNRRQVVLASLVLTLATPDVARGDTIGVSQNGVALDGFLDSLGVEQRWIAGQRVDWFTGEPTGVAERLPGGHTHCSAFVASAAKRLGVYILRPPEHSQKLLANAQADWLAGAQGTAQGWREIIGDVQAQAAANAGAFVVAVYHNHHDDRPGHIAIIRPSAKSADAIRDEGPDITQAGAQNFSITSLKIGFANHPPAWRDHEVRYFVHAINSSIP